MPLVRTKALVAALVLDQVLVRVLDQAGKSFSCMSRLLLRR